MTRASWKDFSRHIKAIYEEVKYECNYCDSTFTDKVKIKGHIWEMHEGVMYDCNHYDSKFTQQIILTQHKLPIHKRVKYYCTPCNYSAS